LFVCFFFADDVHQGRSQRSTDGCPSANQMMPHHLPSVDRVRNRRPKNMRNYTPFKNHLKHLQL
jgi:hypothetical protein